MSSLTSGISPAPKGTFAVFVDIKKRSVQYARVWAFGIYAEGEDETIMPLICGGTSGIEPISEIDEFEDYLCLCDEEEIGKDTHWLREAKRARQEEEKERVGIYDEDDEDSEEEEEEEDDEEEQKERRPKGKAYG